MALINAEIVFLAMLGSGVWTSIQLAQRTACARGRMSRATLGEGAAVALAWCATLVLAAGGVTVALLAQSLIVGAVWIGFGLVARASFALRPQAIR
jgi:hypothetical protein